MFIKNGIKESPSRIIFVICNYIFLLVAGAACIIPLLHVLAVSFSSIEAAAKGQVGLLPVGFHLQAYEYVLGKPEFLTALWITIKRTVLGTFISVTVTVLAAYPLSKSTDVFRWRDAYTWAFFITMLFSGGLIPTYLVVRQTGLINTIWALTLPEAVAVFNIILLLNFFRRLPKELEEAALIDGAGQWAILFRIFIPISKAALATIILFQLVYNWNEWFHGQIYTQKPSLYPLQTYLRTLITPDATGLNLTNSEDIQSFNNVNRENSIAAQIFIAALPIILTYPFLQKYFTKGITLGSVKG